MLEFDSVRPPRHESNFPSFFQVRARGLELETVSIVFALEQLTGPDPSSVPGMLYPIPRQKLHSKHTQNWRLEELPSRRSSSQNRRLEGLPSRRSSSQNRRLEEFPSRRSSSRNWLLKELPSRRSSSQS